MQASAPNSWTGLIGDKLIGPYVIPQHQNSHSYLRFLRDQLAVFLQDVPLVARTDMWYIHGGVPARFSGLARKCHISTYHNHWIGPGASVAWPPRISYLNPLDYCLWGQLYAHVYKEHVPDSIFFCNVLSISETTFVRMSMSSTDCVIHSSDVSKLAFFANVSHFEHL